MNKQTGIFAVFTLLALVSASISNAEVTITAVGDGSGYEEDGLVAFRSTSAAKEFDVDGNDEYGTAGSFFFGNNAGAANGQGWTQHTQTDAAWATFAQGNAFSSVSEQAGYGPYDNPTLSGEDVDDWTICGIGVATGTGAGNWAEILTFSIDSATPDNFRVGVMSGTQSTSDGRWDPTGLRLSVDSGAAAAVTSLANTSGNTSGWVFFDVDLNGATSGTFSLEGENSRSGSYTKGTAISGVTFDTSRETILVGYDFDAVATDMSAATLAAAALTASQLTSPMDISFASTVGDNTGVDATGADFGSTNTVGCVGIGVNDATTSSFEDAVAGNDYVAFTVTPDEGALFQLSSLTFKATKKHANSVDEYAVADGSGNLIGSAVIITNVVGLTGSYDGVVVDLSGTTLETLTEATEIRIYAWGRGTTSTSGTLAALDKVTLYGFSIDGVPPSIDTLSGVSNLLADAATLTGTLTSTGNAPTQVWACWGASDGGTNNVGAWEQSADLDMLPLGNFSVQVTNLTTDMEYVYRCAASNQYGMVWSDVQSFTPSYPRISVDPAQIVEGNSGSSLAIFRVWLSRAYPEAISFTFSTADGSAASSDYDVLSDTLTFLPGETEMQVSITIWGDAVDEGDEDFHLNIDSSDIAVIENGSARGVIFSDDRDFYLSPSELAADAGNDLLYVAESTAARVGIVDLANNTRLASIDLPQNPSGLSLSADGSTLYVTAGVSSGEVYVVDTASRQVTQTISVGHSPREPVLTSENRLYACERFPNTVAVVDLSSGIVTDRIAVLREPHGAALTPDGTKLLVGNLLPHQASTDNGVAASVSVIDTATGLVSTNILLPPGSHSLRDMAVSPDGSYAVVAHALGRYRVPATQIFRGWVNTSVMSVIDLSSETLYNTVEIDDLDEGAANPWGVGFTDDGETLCIAHAGTHELSAIDWPELLAKLAGETGNVCDDLSYLAGLRRRLPLPGNGPRGLAIVGTKAYAAEYFSDSLAVVNLSEGEEYSAETIELGWVMPQTDVRLGKQYFHDATLSVQQWQSCTSCHPGGRIDGLNWDLLNDGFGSPKNVKSLLQAHYTAPTTWTGVRPNAETSVQAGLMFSHMIKWKNNENLYLDAFLMAEQPVPSPYLVDGQWSAAAVRGQAIFNSRCTGCHSGDYLTDQSLHSVGTGTSIDEGPFDTPSLIEVWRTAPYLHDGRAQTIHDVLEVFSHGSTSGLTEEEIDDLVEYVKSL